MTCVQTNVANVGRNLSRQRFKMCHGIAANHKEHGLQASHTWCFCGRATEKYIFLFSTFRPVSQFSMAAMHIKQWEAKKLVELGTGAVERCET